MSSRVEFCRPVLIGMAQAGAASWKVLCPFRTQKTSETFTGGLNESGAGGRNRTDVASLEGWSSTTELHPRKSRLFRARKAY